MIRFFFNVCHHYYHLPFLILFLFILFLFFPTFFLFVLLLFFGFLSPSSLLSSSSFSFFFFFSLSSSSSPLPSIVDQGVKNHKSSKICGACIVLLAMFPCAFPFICMKALTMQKKKIGQKSYTYTGRRAWK